MIHFPQRFVNFNFAWETAAVSSASAILRDVRLRLTARYPYKMFGFAAGNDWLNLWLHRRRWRLLNVIIWRAVTKIGLTRATSEGFFGNCVSIVKIAYRRVELACWPTGFLDIFCFCSTWIYRWCLRIRRGSASTVSQHTRIYTHSTFTLARRPDAVRICVRETWMQRRRSTAFLHDQEELGALLRRGTR